MRRAHRLGAGLALGLAAWVALLLQADLPKHGRLAVLLAPALLVSLMGVFLLVKLVYGVVTFASFPEEAVALQQEVEEAKRELGKLGLLPKAPAK